jgi:4-hydroxy-tetrahydrodipicolinate reductase
MGRMGRAIDAVAAASGWSVVARLGAGESITTRSLADARVALEFTTGTAAPANVRACLDAGCAVVSGTTGWDAAKPAVEREVVTAGGALLWAANFAPGAHLLATLGSVAAAALRSRTDYDATLVETHHAAKRDMPSGTARIIAQGVGDAWGRSVPITSVRVGRVPGVHEIIFDGPSEQLRIVHSVHDRRVFAEGALLAAAWLDGRRGVFSFDDVLASHT